MARESDGQARTGHEEENRERKPHLGDAAFADLNVFNNERHQTEDRQRDIVLDETGEVSTAAVPDRTPRARVGREDPADRQNVGTYDERREEIESDERERD